MSTRLPFTLIDAQGNFNEGIQKDLKLDTETSPLAVVSIIGAQSSGKSTLLNRMFHTEFKEMDAKKGRQRTTKGIRLAKYSREGHCIILIDTEGSDGKERQGNEKFALRTAVFAMAISNIVIINMMCTDVGRESGGGWLLLRMACEAMQRFKPAHQVRLLFVLRDKTNSPLEALESQILDEMKKIIKAQGKARLFDLFKIDVKATSPYLIKGEREKFKAEVRELREWIISRAIRTSKCLPTSSLTTFAKKIWVDVKKDKNLDVPSYEIMIAKELCDRIVKKQRDIFEKDKSWLRIKEKVKKSGSTVRGFGKNVSDLISTRLSRYDDEAKKFDKTVREERRKRLIKDLLEDCVADSKISTIQPVTYPEICMYGLVGSSHNWEAFGQTASLSKSDAGFGFGDKADIRFEHDEGIYAV